MIPFFGFTLVFYVLLKINLIISEIKINKIKLNTGFNRKV